MPEAGQTPDEPLSHLGYSRYNPCNLLGLFALAPELPARTQRVVISVPGPVLERPGWTSPGFGDYPPRYGRKNQAQASEDAPHLGDNDTLSAVSKFAYELEY